MDIYGLFALSVEDATLVGRILANARRIVLEYQDNGYVYYVHKNQSAMEVRILTLTEQSQLAMADVKPE
jgi:hypothetical protein